MSKCRILLGLKNELLETCENQPYDGGIHYRHHRVWYEEGTRMGRNRNGGKKEGRNNVALKGDGRE